MDLGQSREESPVNMLSNENERSYSPQPSTYGSVSEIRAELQTVSCSCVTNTVNMHLTNV